MLDKDTPLGSVVRDDITGLKGISTGRCEYINGCVQFLVAPAVDEKGAYQEAHWVDDQRLELIGPSTVTQGATVTGGPQPNTPPT